MFVHGKERGASRVLALFFCALALHCRSGVTVFRRTWCWKFKGRAPGSSPLNIFPIQEPNESLIDQRGRPFTARSTATARYCLYTTSPPVASSLGSAAVKSGQLMG